MLVVTVKALKDNGWRVTVVIPHDGPLTTALRGSGAQVTILPFPVLRRSGLKSRTSVVSAISAPRQLFRIRQTIAALEPDVLYVNTLVQPLFLVASAMLRMPSIVHVRESEPHWPFLARAAFSSPTSLATTVLTNSQSTADFVKSGRLLSPRNKFHIVYNGKDWEEIPQIPLFENISDPIRILTIGRIAERKGQDLVLEALRNYRGDASIHFRMVGSEFGGKESYSNYLTEMAAQLPSNITVEILPFDENVTRHLTWTNLVVIPSRSEPFGTVAVEALIAGRPTITSDAGGLSEIVEDGVTGRTFSNGDPSDLLRVLLDVIERPRDARKLAVAGRTAALDRFELSTYTNAILHHFERLLMGAR